VVDYAQRVFVSRRTGRALTGSRARRAAAIYAAARRRAEADDWTASDWAAFWRRASFELRVGTSPAAHQARRFVARAQRALGGR
jgi:hypothetical protein